mmetsp:Transcript_40143/g.65946  ORF Transcript_40143/g.65946 Transcript_40143/m.65946 type:complete len:174 (+) Transcript_40143:1-522(+)
MVQSRYLSYFDESSIQKIKKRAATEKAFDTESILEKSKFWLKPNGRHAAVLIPLCNVNGRASILFTVRTDKVSTHKGQVSFPGGHLEPGETAAAAALRETGEELRGLAPPPPRGPAPGPRRRPASGAWSRSPRSWPGSSSTKPRRPGQVQLANPPEDRRRPYRPRPHHRCWWC